ncbi:recombinase family protein [Nocardia otitidiscaviarum]|uniref:recombinase family protein n=1 Tax=Nocardia otitidiscaviarum TaxID=1823 RepID=UPI001894EA41|nr:recombinase family protein [Nocardia otitidiscaviarum]MBF6131604.1 recombinase family protein [Nocardia otitidiscaviarum]
MRLVGYVRTSTKRQRDAYGPTVQKGAIRKWAKENGHRIVAWKQDSITGTSEFKDRAGWVEAEALVKAGKVEGIVVPRLDRLARDVIVQETLIRATADRGGQVFSAVPEENALLTGDPKEPTRKLVRTILGALAEYDRDMVVLRLEAARHAKASAGGYAHGALRYGYRSKGGELVPVPAEQRALARMQALRDQGCSTRAIAKTLAAEGFPTKRGGQWSSPTVSRILSRANDEHLKSSNPTNTGKAA